MGKSAKIFMGLMSVLIFGFTGCSDKNESSNEEVVLESKVHTPESLLMEIEELEKAASNLDLPNHVQVTNQLIQYYEDYAKLFSGNEMAPDMLFRAGNQSVNLENYPKAIELYANVEKHYRQYQKRPECIFLQAFVYETYLNEFGKAKEKYEKLIKQYPDHSLAEQAKQSIDFLGVSDEDRIKQFQN